MICEGITIKGKKKCKIKVKDNKYCKKHLNQKHLNQSSIISQISVLNLNNYFINLNPIYKLDFLKYINIFNDIYSKKLMMNYNFDLNIKEHHEINNYINDNTLKFDIIEIPGDGNCGIYTIYEYLKNKYYIKIKDLKFLMKHIDLDYKNKKWIEIIDIAKVLIFFNYGTIIKIHDNNINNYFYIGFNIQDKYNNNCFINYVNNNHFELLDPNHKEPNNYMDKNHNR